MSKHILNYSQFINEQSMGGPVLPGASPEAPPKDEKRYKFVFIDDDGELGLRRKKYPDGTVSADYPTYSTTETDIKDWTDKNIRADGKLTSTVADIRKKNIVDIVTGKKVNIADDDMPFIEKLKNAVSTDLFADNEPDVNIIFTRKKEPTTQQVDVTFIKIRK